MGTVVAGPNLTVHEWLPDSWEDPAWESWDEGIHQRTPVLGLTTNAEPHATALAAGCGVQYPDV